MALQHSPPHLGEIGDEEPESELEPDRVYERQMEKRIEADE
ncbi:hypothetical protein SAMN05216388_10223 [Halorientalis persicus]|uniref:Uncharacterized protein n=1 Tax=Halorientalis persicus TaxID=1367881 RepID=A0A1H8TCR2_9EURY|nr:hypothetical protein [Halorientalis persicus]SEO88707.1 hypothetical protein SAMN05216388_10223 [Halorientalis persicus]